MCIICAWIQVITLFSSFTMGGNPTLGDDLYTIFIVPGENRQFLSHFVIPQCSNITPWLGYGKNTNYWMQIPYEKNCIWGHHDCFVYVCICMCVHMHLFKLLKRLTNSNEIWYADYAAQGHHSATNVNILQSIITNNMPDEQTSEVEMALASHFRILKWYMVAYLPHLSTFVNVIFSLCVK